MIIKGRWHVKCHCDVPEPIYSSGGMAAKHALPASSRRCNCRGGDKAYGSGCSLHEHHDCVATTVDKMLALDFDELSSSSSTTSWLSSGMTFWLIVACVRSAARTLRDSPDGVYAIAPDINREMCNMVEYLTLASVYNKRVSVPRLTPCKRKRAS
jgi:hypothetical protein